MRLSSITALLKKELPHLMGVYLFGSYATGHETKTSDIDIAILCKKRLSSKAKSHVISQLENCLQKNVDLIELRFTDTIFQEEILRTSKRILTILILSVLVNNALIWGNGLFAKENWD